MLLSSEGRYCNGCVALHTLPSSPHKTTHFPNPNKRVCQGIDTQLRTPSLPSPPILYKPAGGAYQRVAIFRRSQLHWLCSKRTSLFLPPQCNNFHSFNIWQPGNDTQLPTPTLSSPPDLNIPVGGVYQRIPIFRRSQSEWFCRSQG